MSKELEGAELEAAVAKLEGEPIEIRNGKAVHPQDLWPYEYSYTTSWANAGPIIAREKLMIQPEIEMGVYYGNWRAVCYSWEDRVHADCKGPTPLVAAMRAYVKSMEKDE
jgi:hypothetical protein